MIFNESPLAGAYVIGMTHLADERGFFARTFAVDEFAARGLRPAITQCSVSFNAKKATLRGLHYQAAPHAEDKIVRCTAGAIFDVIVDLRTESPTHRQWFGTELSADNRLSLYIPQGFAHGFISLTDAAEVFYMISVAHAPAHARGIRWDDPSLKIRWPLAPAVIAARDAAYPLLDAGSAV